MKIKEDSKVVIFDCSIRKTLDTYIPGVNVEIDPSSIILFDGRLYCIKRIIQISDKHYEIEVCHQNVVLAKDGKLTGSKSIDYLGTKS